MITAVFKDFNKRQTWKEEIKGLTEKKLQRLKLKSVLKLAVLATGLLTEEGFNFWFISYAGDVLRPSFHYFYLQRRMSQPKLAVFNGGTIATY